MELPTIEAFKAQAKAVRAVCDKHGVKISHSASLEALSKQYGFVDWNAAAAALPEYDEPKSVIDHRKLYDLLAGQSDQGLQQTQLLDRSKFIPIASDTYDTWDVPEQKLIERIGAKGLEEYSRAIQKTWWIDLLYLPVGSHVPVEYTGEWTAEFLQDEIEMITWAIFTTGEQKVVALYVESHGSPRVFADSAKSIEKITNQTMIGAVVSTMQLGGT